MATSEATPLKSSSTVVRHSVERRNFQPVEDLIAKKRVIVGKEIEHKERGLKRRALRRRLRKATRQIEAGNDPEQVNTLTKNAAGGRDVSHDSPSAA